MRMLDKGFVPAGFTAESAALLRTARESGNGGANEAH
jgi:hypothetical protein